MPRVSGADPIPWADAEARARVASIVDELGGGDRVDEHWLAATLDRHRRTVDGDGVMLYAGTNDPGPTVVDLHDARLASRPSMGYPAQKYQPWLAALEELEVAAMLLVARVARARFAEIRLASATLANLAVYAALAEPGDAIAVLPAAAGGHLSHHTGGAPSIRGLRVTQLPYDYAAFDVDIGRLEAFLARERPRIVVVGASAMLRRHRVGEIAAVVHDAGATLLYDASHVAGLICAGRFQDPLAEGADLMTFSTYKSFGGPSGGAIVTDSADLAARVAAVAYPGLTANYDASRVAPLAAAALALARDGAALADAMVANARLLAASLARRGLGVVGDAPAFTDTHHVLVDVHPGTGAVAARRLAAAGIYCSEIGIPLPTTDAAGRGVRFGTQEITRDGLDAAAIEAIAERVAEVLLGDDE